jgi:hypothetical protein
LGHPGRKSLLDQLGVFGRQAVLGLQDGDRAGLQVALRQGFDLLDKLRPDCRGLIGAQFFPNGRVGSVPGLELAWTGRRLLLPLVRIRIFLAARVMSEHPAAQG